MRGNYLCVETNYAEQNKTERKTKKIEFLYFSALTTTMILSQIFHTIVTVVSWVFLKSYNCFLILSLMFNFLYSVISDICPANDHSRAR